MLRTFLKILAVFVLCVFCLKYAHALRQFCSDLGLSPGTECRLKSLPIEVISSCFNPDTSYCVLQDCPNGCECVDIDQGCGGGQVCSPCDADTSWVSDYINHYDQRTRYVQNITTCDCSAINEYRCHIGYYNSKSYPSTASIPTCTQCPCLDAKGGGKVCGTTTFTGSSSVKDCYITTNIDFENEVGEWDLVNTCYNDGT